MTNSPHRQPLSVRSFIAGRHEGYAVTQHSGRQHGVEVLLGHWPRGACSAYRWTSNAERAAVLQRFLDRYNDARPHTALKGRPPSQSRPHRCH
jgi:hypothetical protein